MNFNERILFFKEKDKPARVDYDNRVDYYYDLYAYRFSKMNILDYYRLTDEFIYVDQNSPITLTCPMHGLHKTNISNIYNNKVLCPSCTRIKSGANRRKSEPSQSSLERLSNIYKDSFNFTSIIYKNKKTSYRQVKYQCGTCDSKYLSSLSHALKGTLKCKKCKGSSHYINPQKPHLSTQQKTRHEHIKKVKKARLNEIKNDPFFKPKNNTVDERAEAFIKKAKYIHGDIYDYSKVDFINVDTAISIICPYHGEFKQTPWCHINSVHGCPMCSEKYYKNRKYSVNEIIEKFKEVHGNFYDYSKVKYKNIFKPVEIICPEHGVFNQSPKNHLSGNRCPSCVGRVSRISLCWLSEVENENCIREYTIPEVVGVIVDSYDPTTNTVYEFYGDYWHGNPRIYDPNSINSHNGKYFRELYEETLKREEVLRNYGYNLITIWECDYTPRYD